MTYECYCDYEPATVFSERRIKAARKPHKCCECGVEIKPGDSYNRHWGIWDGYASTFVWCARCDELAQWARISVPCFCWCYETLHDDVREMVSEVRHDVPGFMMEWGRRMIAIRRAGGRAF